MRRVVFSAAALMALAAPAAAGAVTITAGPGPSSYQNPNVEIAQGEAVSFMNLDLTASHDVTSVDVGPGAQPLFASPTVGFGTTVPVTGAESLDSGRYDFLCSIHTFMAGTITVRGSGGGGGSPPLLRLTPINDTLAKVKRAGKLTFRTTIDEKATVRVKVTAKGAKVAMGKAKLDRGKDKMSAELTRKGERLVAKGKPLALKATAVATDADGDASTSKLPFELS